MGNKRKDRTFIYTNVASQNGPLIWIMGELMQQIQEAVQTTTEKK